MKLAHTSQTMAKNGQKADLIVLLTFHCETKFMKSDTVISCEAARVENKSLFLTKAVMNFVRERRNGRKRYSHDFEYQKL